MVAALFQHGMSFAGIDKATRDNLRPSDQQPTVLVDRHYHHGNAIARNDVAIMQHHVIDITNTEAVNINMLGINFAGDAGGIAIQLLNITVVEYKGVIARYAHSLS